MLDSTGWDTHANHGAVPGGRVVTDWPGLAAGDLQDGRDLRPTMDLRRLFNGVLRDHLSFGHGEHFCIGASLARAEGRLATDALLDRLGDIVLAPHNTFPMNDTFVLRGMTELHIDFTVR